MRRVLISILLSVVCIAAFGAGCESAISASTSKSCSYTRYTLSTGAGQLNAMDCGWTAKKYKEVWLKTTMPSSGRLSIGTEGNYNDGFMAIYTGSCGALKPYKCSNNGRLPEVVDVTGVKAGETVYIRVAMINGTKVGVCLQEIEEVEKPECSPSAAAADVCSKATMIKSPDGYCGNTSSSYSAEKPGNLQNVFCGSIENNSWLQFVAGEETAELNVFVNNCKMGIGIQMRIYETNDCKKFVSKSNCWNPAIETNGVVKATGLVPGNHYYLMIDGYAGDVCDYTISAGKGVQIAQTMLEASICRGQRYTENGFDVSEAGVYRQELKGPSGKDSIVVLTLTVKEPSNTKISGAIYACERYTENGFNVNTAGKHYRTLTAANGCDSIVELTLSVIPQKEQDIYASICEGDVYRLHGFTESKAGTYTKKLNSVAGCDSIVTLHLEVSGGFNLDVSGELQICSNRGGTTVFASGGNSYIWKDAEGNEIGKGDSIHLNPSVTTSYKLYTKNQEACPASVTDCQGNTYRVTQIGNQCWMAENLRATKYDTQSERPGAVLKTKDPKYGTDFDYGPHYYDPKNGTSEYSGNVTAADRAKFGYLYTWAAAVGLKDDVAALQQTTAFTDDRQGICPNGWHVPQISEFEELMSSIEGGTSSAGVALKANSGWYKGTGSVTNKDSYGFSWLPAGLSGGSFSEYVGYSGTIWSANPGANRYNAYDLLTTYNLSEVRLTCYDKYNDRAVRCVKRIE